jgi:hypothetical protein
MFVKNNRRYVRKNSINSKDSSKPKSSAENGQLYMRKVSSSGKLNHYEIGLLVSHPIRRGLFYR